MAEEADVLWSVCEHERCIGARLDTVPVCLAHATGPELDSALSIVNKSGSVDARGAPISGRLLDAILAAAPRDENGRILLSDAKFGRARFEDDASFGEVTFSGEASFYKATFSGASGFGGVVFARGADFTETTFIGDAGFQDAVFSGDVYFESATFSGMASFRGVTFTGGAWFRGATFSKNAGFSGPSAYGVTFSGLAWFTGANFSGDALFDETHFSGDARFSGTTIAGAARFSATTFGDQASFDNVTFSGIAWFGGATFSGDATFSRAIFDDAANFDEVSIAGNASFAEARFQQSCQFGPLLAQVLDLDGTQFAQPVQIEAGTSRLCCRGARFAGSVQFRLRWARIMLDDTDFPAPSILTGIPRLESRALTIAEERLAPDWQRLPGENISEQPQVLSLRRANVAELTLSNVSMADCLFAGAHNLDKLRLEANVGFATAPTPLGRLNWDLRQVIAEECAWRADRSPRWKYPWWPDWENAGERPGPMKAGQIAGLYRALRKGREDIKDEPGAADFYYGEMQMRRHARPSADMQAGSSSRGRAERALLTVYWLVSGYGLRAWRAFASLILVIALAALAFYTVGFSRPPQPSSLWTSLLYASRATVYLTSNEVELTAWGQLWQLLLRLTGPVLLGLVLLALRGRVKR